MGRLGDFARSLKPGNDQQLAAELAARQDEKNAKQSAKRREKYRARVFRDGDNAATKVPLRHRNHNNGAWN